jgi:hypothetical protein
MSGKYFNDRADVAGGNIRPTTGSFLVNADHGNRNGKVGATKDEVRASDPSLRADHINAALAYAAELAYEERLVPIRAV